MLIYSRPAFSCALMACSARWRQFRANLGAHNNAAIHAGPVQATPFDGNPGEADVSRYARQGFRLWPFARFAGPCPEAFPARSGLSDFRSVFAPTGLGHAHLAGGGLPALPAPAFPDTRGGNSAVETGALVGYRSHGASLARRGTSLAR